jgi:septation ring formation regulator EzrA
MKKQILMVGTLLVMIVLSIGTVAAQDAGKMKMEMDAMKKSPHHLVMMAYKHNLLSFSKALRDMSNGGKLEDVDLARNAFAEIKRSMEKMDEVHQMHTKMMKPEMMTMMKPMMEKMQAENMSIKEHIADLEKTFQATAPNALEVNKHSSEIVMQLEKMDMHDKKMKM